ncbi:lipase family protein [Thioalkalivibrio sp. ALJ7]|uniref:lipase family protein n=1 Tax=Thioalkalivibrio sp. ALJ7 TaxID=1158756 RepID=UPI00036CCDC7|nr:lipase family protein [Thioalkalivibrio sp. ALJ7]
MDIQHLPFPDPAEFGDYDTDLASCMAAHSALVYKGHREIATTLTAAGYDRVVIFRDGGTNAYLARCSPTPEERGRRWVLAWRGTEADYQDIIADVTFLKRTSDYRNKWRVHGGFLTALQGVWGSWWEPDLPDEADGALVTRVGSEGVTEIIASEVDAQDRLVVTGHSLGGALAQLAAFYLHRDVFPDRDQLAAVYTFGSPRVFGADQAKHLESASPYPHFRIVNGADLVPRVPPMALNFRHTGRNVYIERSGGIRKDPSWWCVFKDVGWRQAVLVVLTLLLVWGGFAWLESADLMASSWPLRGAVMAVLAGGAVLLLPKLLRLLPGTARWRLVSDHFMEAYATGVKQGRS